MDFPTVDEMLEILSNNYRRTILRLLTEKERYAYELTKILDISQRAIKNHLNALEDMKFIRSEKRKSTKGPKREYYMLNESMIFSLTIAPNLFLAALRPLQASNTNAPINPSMQLNPPDEQENHVENLIKNGLLLLPQIREGLDLLQAEQSKLLRGYQGIKTHISEHLNNEDFSSKEIKLILHLMENNGTLQPDQIDFTYGGILEINDAVNSLAKADIISVEKESSDSGLETRYTLYLNDGKL